MRRNAAEIPASSPSQPVEPPGDQGRRVWSLADIAAELDRPAKGTWMSPGLATLEEFLTPVRDHTEWSKLGLPPGIAFRSRRRLTMGATRHLASFVISLSRVLLWSFRIGARLSRPRSR